MNFCLLYLIHALASYISKHYFVKVIADFLNVSVLKIISDKMSQKQISIASSKISISPGIENLHLPSDFHNNQKDSIQVRYIGKKQIYTQTFQQTK